MVSHENYRNLLRWGCAARLRTSKRFVRGGEDEGRNLTLSSPLVSPTQFRGPQLCQVTSSLSKPWVFPGVVGGEGGSWRPEST